MKSDFVPLPFTDGRGRGVRERRSLLVMGCVIVSGGWVVKMGGLVLRGCVFG